MTDWFAKIPASMSQHLKDYFELELLYSYIYILSPSPRCPQISEHAQRLIVENCTFYAKKVLHLITQAPDVKSPSLFTFYDALRVYMTGRHFVDVLSSNLDALLQTSTADLSFPVTGSSIAAEVDPLAPDPCSMPPPLPTPTSGAPSGGSTTRATNTINEFISILSTFGIRFGYVSGVSWRDRFQKESQPLLSELQQRMQQHGRTQSEDSSYPFWTNGGPLTPQSNLSTSPRRSNAFYPSPAATQYSPGYVPLELESSPMNSAWSVPSSRHDATSISSAGFGSGVQEFSNAPLFPAAADGNEFGIGSMAAWETIPGGSLNARFS
jgi:hypothetical protein